MFLRKTILFYSLHFLVKANEKLKMKGIANSFQSLMETNAKSVPLYFP